MADNHWESYKCTDLYWSTPRLRLNMAFSGIQAAGVVCCYWLKCVYMDKRRVLKAPRGACRARAFHRLPSDSWLLSQDHNDNGYFLSIQHNHLVLQSARNAPWKPCSSFCGRQWITAIIFSLTHTHTHTPLHVSHWCSVRCRPSRCQTRFAEYE